MPKSAKRTAFPPNNLLSKKHKNQSGIAISPFLCGFFAKHLHFGAKMGTLTILFFIGDLFKWEFVKDLFGEDSPGIMIECPDYNEELGHLLFCEQFQPSENGIHLNIHTTRYCIGRIDYSTGRFEEKARGIVDYGFDIYAPQTFVGKDVLMGWLNMWERNVPSDKYGFAGMLTVARRVSIKDGRLYQEPAINCKEAYKATVSGTLCDKVKRGVVTIKATDLESLEIKMRSNQTNYTTLSLKDGEWVFCRALSGEVITGAEKDSDSINGIRRMPYSKKRDTTLTIVMDDYSLEIFEDGRVLSSTIYPPEDADCLELTVKAEDCQYERAEVALKE